MKRLIFTLGLALLLIGVIASGCQSADNDINAVPPVDNSTKSMTIEVNGADFDAQPFRVDSAEVVYPGSVVLSLDSNATTGFSWTAEPKNSNPAVISQYEHNYIAPTDTGVVGAAGKEVWTFKPLTTGTATLTFEYNQPWEGGQKAVRTYQLTITVK